jgi:hypothetical protein
MAILLKEQAVNAETRKKAIHPDVKNFLYIAMVACAEPVEVLLPSLPKHTLKNRHFKFGHQQKFMRYAKTGISKTICKMNIN